MRLFANIKIHNHFYTPLELSVLFDSMVRLGCEKIKMYIPDPPYIQQQLFLSGKNQIDGRRIFAVLMPFNETTEQTGYFELA